MSKQDRQGVRTPAELEMKYNFGKSFAEVMGIANDARDTADKAIDAVDNFDSSLDSEEIFNRLTENGALEGLYREDGQLYINASYIKSGSIFSEHSKVFLAADYTEEDRTRIEQILSGTITPTAEDYQRYDIWGDGKINGSDWTIIRNMLLGQYGDWIKVKWTITITPSDAEHFIRVHRVTEYATGDKSNETEVFNLCAGGVNALTLVHSNMDGILSLEEGTYGGFVRTVDGEQEWLCPPMFPNTEYRTTERYLGKPVYTALLDIGALPKASSTTVTLSGKKASSVVRYNVVVRDTSGNERNAEQLSGISDVCVRADGSQSLYIRIVTTTDLSTQTAKAQVWYTYG